MRDKPYNEYSSVDAQGRAWGMSEARIKRVKRRAKIGMAVSKAIRESGLTHAQIAKRAGASRTRITALANGSANGCSDEYLFRVLDALDYDLEFRIFKTRENGKRVVVVAA